MNFATRNDETKIVAFSRLKDLYTKSERGVNFHPKSVLAKQRKFNTQFFAYFLKQRLDSGVMLFDATAVHPLTLLIFAADCDYNPELERFSINGWMEIHCDPLTARLISVSSKHSSSRRLYYWNRGHLIRTIVR